MIETATISVEVAGGTATFSAEPRTFRSGSRGFFGVTKVKARDGRRFQVIVNVVEIGSKQPAVAVTDADNHAGAMVPRRRDNHEP